MTTRLGMALSKLMFEHEPELLACDLAATARAASEVADLLGCIMATVLAKEGNAVYLEGMRLAMNRAHSMAVKVANQARTMKPNTTNH